MYILPTGLPTFSKIDRVSIRFQRIFQTQRKVKTISKAFSKVKQAKSDYSVGSWVGIPFTGERERQD